MKGIKKCILILSFLPLLALPGYASSSFRFSKPQKKIWVFLFSLGATYAGDPKIRTLVQKNRTGGTDDLARIMDNFGRGEVLFPLTGALYYYGKKTGRERLARASRDAMKNMLISGGITSGIKWAIGRARPLEEKGPRSFHPFSNRTSFPSGHTSMAFAAASAYAQEYPGEVKLLSYTLAVLVAYSRLNKDAHWASDALASALFSTELARRLRHRKKFPLLSFTHKTLLLTWTR